MSRTTTAVDSVQGALDALPDSGMLIKRDRPRSIDRYIDYFGDGAKTVDLGRAVAWANTGTEGGPGQ